MMIIKEKKIMHIKFYICTLHQRWINPELSWTPKI